MSDWDQARPWRDNQQGNDQQLSLTHDLSGLGGTRVVRLGVPVWRRLDEPDDMATGTQDGDVSGGATKAGQFRLLTTGKDQRRRISNV